MSRFYFDKNAITGASSKLGKTCSALSFEYFKFDFLISNVEHCEGFEVEQAAEVLRAEKQMLFSFIDSVKRGQTALNEITAKVELYSKMADSEKLRNIVDYANAQDPNKLPNMFYIFNVEASFIPEKYFTGWSAWGVIFSQIKTALLDTIKGGSYEKELLERNLAKIIGKASENGTLKDFLSGDSEEMGELLSFSEKYLDYTKDVDGFFKKFCEEYKGNPITNVYGSIKNDVKLVEYLVNDYSKNMEYLNSLERTLEASGYDKGIVDVVMNEIKQDYNNKYFAAISNFTTDTFMSFSEGALEATPIGRGVLLTLDIMEFIDIESDSKMDYAIIRAYENDMFFSYEKLEKTIKSGNYTEQDLMDYENMFNFIKTMETQKFNSALDFVKGESDKEICERAVDYYSNLTM